MPAPFSYDNKQKQLVHQLIEAIFSGHELDRFCVYYYPALYYRFRPDISSASKIRLVVEYAGRRRQLGKLVACIQSAKPEEYQTFVQRVRARPEAFAPPVKSPQSPTPSSLAGLNGPHREAARPGRDANKKWVVPTWVLSVVLVALLFLAAEPVSLIISPLYADKDSVEEEADQVGIQVVVVEHTSGQETSNIPAAVQNDANQAATSAGDTARDRGNARGFHSN
jgi:hypothetical protein